MEILSHQIHVCNNLWMLKNDASGSCVLQRLIHQGQNGLLRLQSHLHGIKTQQGAAFKSLEASFKLNLQNLQAAHQTQYQKNKQPNPKMGRRPKETFLQRRYTACQQAHGKLLNSTNY